MFVAINLIFLVFFEEEQFYDHNSIIIVDPVLWNDRLSEVFGGSKTWIRYIEHGSFTFRIR